MLVNDQTTHSNKNHKGVILLVSNSKKINNPLINQLSQYRYKVILANDGFDALEKLRSMKIDLIITRLNLKGMDCLELLMHLRDFNIDSPVIILKENNKKEEEGSISILDVIGYCCTPGVKVKIRESINLITSDQID